MNNTTVYSLYGGLLGIIVAVSLTAGFEPTNSLAQSTTESDAASIEESQSSSQPLELISTIQSLLDLTVDECGKQNYVRAAELAQIAYFDNYEFLEAPLAERDPALMQSTEILIRDELQNAINNRAPCTELQALVNNIHSNLESARQLFP